MPGSHSPPPRKDGKPLGKTRSGQPSIPKISPRLIIWLLSLIILSITCATWSSLPKLESSPLLRVALFAAMGLAMLGTVFSFPKVSRPIIWILAPAILLRAILWPAPVSEDVNRYLWEGMLVAEGKNPYMATADDSRWQDRRDDIWQAMNHRDRPTAYPPGSEWIMAATTSVHPSLKSFKVLSVIGDLVTLLLLFLLLRESAAPMRWACFYAFNPVILISFAAEAHFDSLMIAAMLGTLIAASHRKTSLSFLLLGLSIQIKIIAIVLAPLIFIPPIKNLRSRPSSLVIPILLFLSILILPSLPFASALPEWWAAVHSFASSGDFNAPLFTLLASSGLSPEFTRMACLAVFCLCAAAISIARWKGLPIIDASLWMLGALLTCSPIVHFWYLAWLVPFIALRPSFAWTTVSITIAGYFIAWHTLATKSWWGFEHNVAIVIWLPWLLAGLAQNRFLIQKIRNANFGNLEKAPPELAIVIPALEINPTLHKLTEALVGKLPENSEIIISTCSPTQEEIYGTKKVISSQGRGNQIAAGIDATTCPWILIVHADASPPPNFYESFVTSIQKKPNASIIVFGQRFDHNNFGTLLVEALNEIRVVFGGVAFGDQSMVIRRSALEAIGGFPAQPLMEDVEASLRLATKGGVHYIGNEWQVSAKKWNNNFGPRFVNVIRLVAIYQLARLKGPAKAASVSEKMYTEYYGPKTKP